MLVDGLAAIGAILLTLYEQGTPFDASAQLLELMAGAVTLGGLVGSLIIGIVMEVSTVWLAPDLKFAVTLNVLTRVPLFRPRGILGRAERVGEDIGDLRINALDETFRHTTDAFAKGGREGWPLGAAALANMGASAAFGLPLG